MLNVSSCSLLFPGTQGTCAAHLQGQFCFRRLCHLLHTIFHKPQYITTYSPSQCELQMPKLVVMSEVLKPAFCQTFSTIFTNISTGISCSISNMFLSGNSPEFPHPTTRCLVGRNNCLLRTFFSFLLLQKQSALILPNTALPPAASAWLCFIWHEELPQFSCFQV